MLKIISSIMNDLIEGYCGAWSKAITNLTLLLIVFIALHGAAFFFGFGGELSKGSLLTTLALILMVFCIFRFLVNKVVPLFDQDLKNTNGEYVKPLWLKDNTILSVNIFTVLLGLGLMLFFFNLMDGYAADLDLLLILVLEILAPVVWSVSSAFGFNTLYVFFAKKPYKATNADHTIEGLLESSLDKDATIEKIKGHINRDGFFTVLAYWDVLDFIESAKEEDKNIKQRKVERDLKRDLKREKYPLIYKDS